MEGSVHWADNDLWKLLQTSGVISAIDESSSVLIRRNSEIGALRETQVHVLMEIWESSLFGQWERKEMKYVWKIAGELAFHSTTNLHPHFPMHYAHRFGARMSSSSLHTANIRKKVIISQRFTRMKVKSIVKLFCFPNRKSLEKIKRREDLIREKLNVRAWKLSRKKIKPMRDSLFVSIETARYLTIIWLEADVI